MPAGRELVEARVGRRAMHVLECHAERWQAEVRDDIRRDPVAQRTASRGFQRQRREQTQPSLLDPLGRGIDGCQRIRDGLGVGQCGQPVLRVHDLESEGATAHLAEAAQPDAALQLLLLSAAEMEESQRQMAGAVVETHE
jgi:hypothetical protein